MTDDAGKAGLRQRALARLGAGAQAPADAQSASRLMHELRVHQVELELQNEELRRAHDELRESETRYRLLSEMATDCVMWIDPDSRVRYASPACAGLFGHSCEALAADPTLLQRVIHPADRGRLAAHPHGPEATGPLHVRVIRPDGRERWVEHHCQPMYDENRQLLGWRSTNTDATDRLRLRDELQLHRDQLSRLVEQRTAQLAAATTRAEAASAAKSQFLANMSHEIRTPLNGVLGMAQLLRRSGLRGAQADQLDKLDVCARHLRSVVDDILDLTRIEAGRLTLQPGDFDLGQLVTELDTVVGSLARAKGLWLRVDIGDVPRRLSADAPRLRQALVNYLANAVKFTSQGGVTLRCRVQERSASEVVLRFEVEDTGIGIAPDQLQRIFEDFAQVDGAMTREFGGTGLGLSITRRLVGLMGGQTGVQSTPGQGSLFWLTVRAGIVREPADPHPPSAASGVEQRLQLEHAGQHILLAEDEPVSREVGAALLAAVGLQVDVAEHGELAVALARDNDYAAILMDLQMPVLDGPSAARQIRAMARHARTPIVALTANVLETDRQRCLDAGMNDLLPKPLDSEQLFGTLLLWLDRRQSGEPVSGPASGTPEGPG